MSKKTRASKEQETSQETTPVSHGMSKYARKKQMQAQAALRAEQEDALERSQEAQKAADKARAREAARKERRQRAFARAEQALLATGTGQIALKQQSFRSARELREQAQEEARAAALAKEYTGQEDGGVNLSNQPPKRLFTLVHKPIEQINSQTQLRTYTIRNIRRDRRAGLIDENLQPTAAAMTQANTADGSTNAAVTSSGAVTYSNAAAAQTGSSLDSSGAAGTGAPSAATTPAPTSSATTDAPQKKTLSLRSRSAAPADASSNAGHTQFKTSGFKPKVYNSTLEEPRWSNPRNYRKSDEPLVMTRYGGYTTISNLKSKGARFSYGTGNYGQGLYTNPRETVQGDANYSRRPAHNHAGHNSRYPTSVRNATAVDTTTQGTQATQGTDTKTSNGSFTSFHDSNAYSSGYTAKQSRAPMGRSYNRGPNQASSGYSRNPRELAASPRTDNLVDASDGDIRSALHQQNTRVEQHQRYRSELISQLEARPQSRRTQRRLNKLRYKKPIKGTDPFAKFIDGWSERMDPNGLWKDALYEVCRVRREEDGAAFTGVPAFLKFLEGKNKRQIVDEYAFEFKLFIRRFEVTNFIDSMRAVSDNWWNNRPNFDSSYSLVYFDTVPVRFRQEDKQVKVEHVLLMIGVTLNGRTDLLGCLPEFKASNLDIKWWENIFAYFQNLGMQNICYLVASFKCRYLERALSRYFPETTLQWNLLEVLQFNSYALPTEMRKAFMQEAQVMCDAADVESAMSMLDAMRTKWEPLMENAENFGDGILVGNVDLLERQASLPQAMRVILNTNKIIGNARSLLLGKKDSRDHFSDHPEMLSYMFYRYILLARYEWAQHIGETVCNLNFKQLFTQLRNMNCHGGKLLESLLSQHQRNFLEKYFGRFGPGPVVSYQSRANRMTVRVEQDMQVESNIWSDNSSDHEADVVGQELTTHLASFDDVPQGDLVSEMMSVNQASQREVSASFVDVTKLDQMDKTYSYARPNFSMSSVVDLEAPAEGAQAPNYSTIDEDSLQQATIPTMSMDQAYEHYQPFNAVPGMLKPSIASALKSELRYIRFQERTNSLWWIGGSSFGFTPINCIEHSISPIFKVALKKKYELRDEFKKLEQKKERQRKAKRAHLNYLKRHNLTESEAKEAKLQARQQKAKEQSQSATEVQPSSGKDNTTAQFSSEQVATAE